MRAVSTHLEAEALVRVKLDEQARVLVVLAHALRLVVQAARGEGLEQIGDAFPLCVSV